jgi:hypothetical protein
MRRVRLAAKVTRPNRNDKSRHRGGFHAKPKEIAGKSARAALPRPHIIP